VFELQPQQGKTGAATGSGRSYGYGASPWQHLNLRRNPFGEPPEDCLPELVVADVDTMVEWLERPRHALQLIGECGRGKSARLHAIRSRMQALYVYLAEGAPIPSLPQSGRLLLDEGQRLPRRRRRALFARLESVAVATHEDLTGELEAAGWQVLAIEVGGVDGRLFEKILERRLEWARFGPGPLPKLPADQQADLLRRHGDDLRSALDELYEIYQRRVAEAAASSQTAGEQDSWPVVI
jgi:hypothetical protein